MLITEKKFAEREVNIPWQRTKEMYGCYTFQPRDEFLFRYTIDRDRY